jgi:hypothetical protein
MSAFPGFCIGTEITCNQANFSAGFFRSKKKFQSRLFLSWGLCTAPARMKARFFAPRHPPDHPAQLPAAEEFLAIAAATPLRRAKVLSGWANRCAIARPVSSFS